MGVEFESRHIEDAPRGGTESIQVVDALRMMD
jgi:hypothetical protein